KAHPRLKIELRRIREERISEVWGCRSQRWQIREFPMCFAHHRRRFITQPQIDSQIGPRSPVVHDVSRINRLPEVARRDSASDGRVKRSWLILQESGKRSEHELP